MSKLGYIKKYGIWLVGTIIGYILYDIYSEVKIIIISAFKQETFKEFINVFLSMRVSIPLWLVSLLFIVFIIIIISKIRFFILSKFKVPNPLKLFNKSKKQSIKRNGSFKIISESPKDYQPRIANQSYNISINSKYLDLDSGIFSIWAYVSDVHNEKPERNMYIVGYATKGGISQNDTNFARYPNAWAICRVRPTEKYPYGIWRFWCNSVSTDQIRIDYTNLLTSGWHLFSVAWSKKSNYIKFLIDNQEVGVREFDFWPSDFSNSIILGTWANKSPVHYFESHIGRYRLVEAEFDMKIIEDFFRTKPKQK